MTFEKSKFIHNKIRKDQNSTPLQGQLNPPVYRYPEKEITDEYVRIAEASARRKAIGLYNEVWETNHDILSARESLFVEGTKPKSDNTVSVGTDCSGIEAPLQALDNLQVYYKHKFSSEIDPVARETITSNWKPQKMLKDIKNKNPDAHFTWNVDIYCAGFPCQPFSQAGKQQGFDDDKGRGEVFWQVHKYIDKYRPKYFVLENVKGFVQLDNGKCLRTVLDALNSIKFADSNRSAYTIQHQVLNTQDYGIPQYRPRWYCVGIRRSAIRGSGGRAFQFPSPTPTPLISEFLDARATSNQESDLSKETATARCNIDNAMEKIRKEGKDPTKDLFVIDCDASKARTKHMLNVSPCLTRSRPNGHWMTKMNRRMTLDEMMKLQGIDPSKVKLAGSPVEQGQQIGNAMSVNVIQLILKEILSHHLSEEEGAKLGKMMYSQSPRTLIIDSGATFHMVNRNTLTPQERKTVRSCPTISLNTANGSTSTSEIADVHVQDLDITVTALILKDTESVLSMGKLVNENGYSVSWPAGKAPVLSKNGKHVSVLQSQNVPVLQVGTTPDARGQPQESGGSIEPTQLELEPTQVECPPTQIEETKPTKRKKSKTVSGKCEHNIFTHFPKSDKCEICRDNKTHRAYCRSHSAAREGNLPIPKKFGDMLTADHKILGDEDESLQGDKVACVIQDKATYWLQAYPAPTKSADETANAFKRFLGPEIKCKHVYTDNSKEFKKALADLQIDNDTSTPHRSETNGIAENAVKRVKEGTSCVLSQSGLASEWWSWAMACYCWHRVTTDILACENTSYELRFGKPWGGPKIPFGAAVKYQPSSQKDKARLHQLTTKVLDGIFIGYHQMSGGNWNGDLYVIDQEELANASSAAEVTVKRFKASEVHVEKVEGNFYFPVASGECVQPHADDHMREVQERKRARKEKAEQAKAEAEETVPAEEPIPSKPDYWTITSDTLTRHHLTPRTKMFVPTERELPIPIKFLDVHRLTITDIDEFKEREIKDLWPLEEQRELSTTWTGRTTFQIMRPKPKDGHKWIDGRLTRIQKNSNRPDSIRPEEWTHLSKKEKLSEISKWNELSPKIDASRTKTGITGNILATDIEEYDDLLQKAKETYGLPPVAAMQCIQIHKAMSAARPGDNISDSIPKKGAAARQHQNKVAPLGTASEFFHAMVHKPIPLKKALQHADASQALEKEWKKLEAVPAWDPKKVKPWAKVQADSKRTGRPAHRATLLQLCSVKNAELAPEFQSYKGRVCLRGDIVKDDEGHLAVFSEQGASSAHMTQTKFLDTIAHLPGCHGEDADAVGAYHQIRLSEAERLLGVDTIPETWVSLPRNRRPKSWDNIEDPVVPLECNLYGHPLAGLLWDKGSQEKICETGFERVLGWESLYVHRKLQIFLGVYVDDFHMAGKSANLKPAWEMLRKKMDLGPSLPFNQNTYLGCTQKEVAVDDKLIKEKQQLIKTVLSTVTIGLDEVEPDTDGYATARSTKKTKSKKSVNAPATVKTDHTAMNASQSIRAWEYQMHGSAEKCVERYLELANMKIEQLKPVTTPCIDDHLISVEDFETKGHLAPHASKAVLKCLYLARKARPDLLWTVNDLARNVTKWNVASDKRLHRLICYIHTTYKYSLHCYAGDPPDKCSMWLFTDASFAADTRDSKSTSGVLLCVVGPNTWAPVAWFCKKQGATSHSSSEAEIISLDAGLRMEALPCLDLWDLVIEVFSGKRGESAKKPHPYRASPGIRLQDDIDFVPQNADASPRRTQLVLLQDNSAVISMCIKGRAPTLRHVLRVHKINLDFIFELMTRESKTIKIKYINTKLQVADLLTKGSFSESCWKTLLRLFQFTHTTHIVSGQPQVDDKHSDMSVSHASVSLARYHVTPRIAPLYHACCARLKPSGHPLPWRTLSTIVSLLHSSPMGTHKREGNTAGASKPTAPAPPPGLTPSGLTMMPTSTRAEPTAAYQSPREYDEDMHDEVQKRAQAELIKERRWNKDRAPNTRDEEMDDADEFASCAGAASSKPPTTAKSMEAEPADSDMFSAEATPAVPEGMTMEDSEEDVWDDGTDPMEFDHFPIPCRGRKFNRQARFHYILKSYSSDGKLKMVWDHGCTDSEIKTAESRVKVYDDLRAFEQTIELPEQYKTWIAEIFYDFVGAATVKSLFPYSHLYNIRKYDREVRHMFMDDADYSLHVSGIVAATMNTWGSTDFSLGDNERIVQEVMLDACLALRRLRGIVDDDPSIRKVDGRMLAKWIANEICCAIFDEELYDPMLWEFFCQECVQDYRPIDELILQMVTQGVWQPRGLAMRNKVLSLVGDSCLCTGTNKGADGNWQQKVKQDIAAYKQHEGQRPVLDFKRIDVLVDVGAKLPEIQRQIDQATTSSDLKSDVYICVHAYNDLRGKTLIDTNGGCAATQAISREALRLNRRTELMPYMMYAGPGWPAWTKDAEAVSQAFPDTLDAIMSDGGTPRHRATGLFTALEKTVKNHFSGQWENQKRIWQMIDDCAAYMHFRNQLITNVMLKQVQDNPVYLEEQHTAKWTHISRDMQKFKDMHNAGKDTRATAVWPYKARQSTSAPATASAPATVDTRRDPLVDSLFGPVQKKIKTTPPVKAPPAKAVVPDTATPEMRSPPPKANALSSRATWALLDPVDDTAKKSAPSRREMFAPTPRITPTLATKDPDRLEFDKDTKPYHIKPSDTNQECGGLKVGMDILAYPGHNHYMFTNLPDRPEWDGLNNYDIFIYAKHEEHGRTHEEQWPQWEVGKPHRIHELKVIIVRQETLILAQIQAATRNTYSWILCRDNKTRRVRRDPEWVRKEEERLASYVKREDEDESDLAPVLEGMRGMALATAPEADHPMEDAPTADPPPLPPVAKAVPPPDIRGRDPNPPPPLPPPAEPDDTPDLETLPADASIRHENWLDKAVSQVTAQILRHEGRTEDGWFVWRDFWWTWKNTQNKKSTPQMKTMPIWKWYEHITMINQPRYQVLWPRGIRSRDKWVTVMPLKIKTIAGNSNLVGERDQAGAIPVVNGRGYHMTTQQHVDSIKHGGIAVMRNDSYHMLAPPTPIELASTRRFLTDRRPHTHALRLAYNSGQLAHKNAMVVWDIERWLELDSERELYQTANMSCTTSHLVPPDCIIRIVEWPSQRPLWENPTLAISGELDSVGTAPKAAPDKHDFVPPIPKAATSKDEPSDTEPHPEAASSKAPMRSRDHASARNPEPIVVDAHERHARDEGDFNPEHMYCQSCLGRNSLDEDRCQHCARTLATAEMIELRIGNYDRWAFLLKQLKKYMSKAEARDCLSLEQYVTTTAHGRQWMRDLNNHAGSSVEVMRIYDNIIVKTQWGQCKLRDIERRINAEARGNQRALNRRDRDRDPAGVTAVRPERLRSETPCHSEETEDEGHAPATAPATRSPVPKRSSQFLDDREVLTPVSSDDDEPRHKPKRSRSGEYSNPGDYYKNAREKGYRSQNDKDHADYVHGRKSYWKEPRDWDKESSVNDDSWNEWKQRKAKDKEEGKKWQSAGASSSSSKWKDYPWDWGYKPWYEKDAEDPGRFQRWYHDDNESDGTSSAKWSKREDPSAGYAKRARDHEQAAKKLSNIKKEKDTGDFE